MSRENVIQKLQELNEKIDSMSPQEVQDFFNIVEKTEQEETLDVHSPEFLRQT